VNIKDCDHDIIWRGGTDMQEPSHIKDEAHKLIESLPDDATWEDLTRLMLEQQLIEEGIADVEAGRVWTSDQIREKLGMSQ
jgi:predicted transcriptional regulator